MGYDVHKLVADRDLWLGGIKIDYELGYAYPVFRVDTGHNQVLYLQRNPSLRMVIGMSKNPIFHETT